MKLCIERTQCVFISEVSIICAGIFFPKVTYIKNFMQKTGKQHNVILDYLLLHLLSIEV